MLNRTVDNLSSVLSHHLNGISGKGLHWSNEHRRLWMATRLRDWYLNRNIQHPLVAAVHYLHDKTNLTVIYSTNLSMRT